MFVFVFLYDVILALACVLGLNVVKAYNVTDYKQFYLALYGLQGEHSNPILRRIVTYFFDGYTILKGITSCAAAMSLFGTLCNSMLGINAILGAFLSVPLFAFLTIYGGAFLRKFNTIITVGLLLSLLTILAAVCMDRGDIMADRLFNFQVGLDWSGATLAAGFAGVLAYCSNVTSWGGTLSSYSEKIRDGKDVVGAGITIGVIVPSLFLLTAMIVLPYLPEEMNTTPILNIVNNYIGSTFLLVLYYIVIILSVISTGPAFTFSITARYEKVWTSQSVSLTFKRFVISFIFLGICWGFSNFGLMFLVKGILGATGTVSVVAIMLPLFIAVPRIRRKQKMERALREVE